MVGSHYNTRSCLKGCRMRKVENHWSIYSNHWSIDLEQSWPSVLCRPLAAAEFTSVVYFIHELFSSHTYEGLGEIKGACRTRQRKSLKVSALGSEDRSWKDSPYGRSVCCHLQQSGQAPSSLAPLGAQRHLGCPGDRRVVLSKLWAFPALSVQ